MTAADSKIRNRGKFSEHPPITHKGSIHPAPSRAMLTLKKCTLSFQWVCHSAVPHWSSSRGLLRAGLYLSKGAALEWQLTESSEQDDLISKDVCSLCAFPRLLFFTIRKSHRYYLSLSQSEELLWRPQHPTCTMRTMNFQATGRLYIYIYNCMMQKFSQIKEEREQKRENKKEKM